MRPCWPFALCFFTSIHLVTANESRAPDSFTSGSAVIREINLARQNPALYASHLEDLRSHYDGNFLLLPGHAKIRTQEGVRGLDEAIQFLCSVRPLPTLILSPGMCRSAADHCSDQAGGGLGHTGRDGSNPARRLSRYGIWGSAWAENISYGKRTAREVVIQLIVDDGLPGRKHRKNIFNPNFNYAGAASGPHAIYRTVCNIDFAGAYMERDSALVARNY